jgi:ribA/ribD-fused uncharacterized protein
MIDNFRGDYFFLSNFSHSKMTINGWLFDNAESAFHSFKNLDMQANFQNLDPSSAKKMGRMVKLRDDWENVKDAVMEMVVHQKFEQNPHLIKKLLNTKDEELIEGNDWNDRYWGVCKGVGLNKLGQILMNEREYWK